MTKYKILVVDDDEYVRNMIVRYLQMKGYEVTSAVNGKEAVLKEEKIYPDLVILDVEMPEMNGFEACKIIREKRYGLNYVPIIFLSGSLTEGSVITGLELGADDFVKKPFEPLELLTRIKNLLKMKDFIAQVDLLESMVFTLVTSIEARDFYTASHSRRVSLLSGEIGRELGLQEEEIEILKKSALLHDIGKIGIPDRILNKKGKLMEEEFNLIKEHPGKGTEICKSLKLDPEVMGIIRHHHEKIDGSGYPDGLKGDEISKLIRIVTIADIFDAVTTNRPYHPAKSSCEAMSILTQEANEGKLDALIVKKFNEYFKVAMPS
ncbi:MAG: hypothetical protein A2252_02180 [Elusimicrobia bacterium RIFOXYA2_FULL_39_19]|nr:MAG: hypothetical protein A2252_02180 [Elusimicrobia bacterium RIFOXYA2_FULL_39_19]